MKPKRDHPQTRRQGGVKSVGQRLVSQCFILGFWILSVGVSAFGGPVVDLITQAKIAGSEDVDAQVSPRFIEFGLRDLAPSDALPADREAIVSDALYIVIHRTETDEVLGGLMRGLAIIRESTNTDIVPTLCFYASSGSSGPQLQLEAWEALRIRCLDGEGDTNACACFYSLPPPQAIVTLRPPSLAMSVSPGGSNLVLSWPASATGYQLEVNSDLSQPNGWHLVTTPPLITNDLNVITIPITGTAQFYRLRK